MGRGGQTQRGGVSIFKGHHSENIGNCDVLVYSSAVNLENPEVKFAKDLGIPVIRRAEMLGELMKFSSRAGGGSRTQAGCSGRSAPGALGWSWIEENVQKMREGGTATKRLLVAAFVVNVGHSLSKGPPEGCG